MRLRCRIGTHRWVGARGLWWVPISRPEIGAAGRMETEACVDCQILRYTYVSASYEGERQ